MQAIVEQTAETNPVMIAWDYYRDIEARKMGRPSTYTPELAYRVLEQLAQGRTLSAVCECEWAPGWSTVWGWIDRFPEFAHAVARARTRQTYKWADDIQGYADKAAECSLDRNARPDGYRVAMQGLQWLIERLNPAFQIKQGNQAATVGVSVSIAGLDRPVEVAVIAGQHDPGTNTP